MADRAPTALRRLRRVGDAIGDRSPCCAHDVAETEGGGETALEGLAAEPTASQRWLFDTQGYLLLPDVENAPR